MSLRDLVVLLVTLFFTGHGAAIVVSELPFLEAADLDVAVDPDAAADPEEAVSLALSHVEAALDQAERNAAKLQALLPLP